ncbi:MAG: DUF3486 family protein [Rhodospirillales bacterium]|nr:DUF3486 family protein [Rhodospirillales bacterium]
MGRQSTIDRLPDELRDLIGRLREKGRTIDEILAKLGEMDADVSRSALGRHVKKLDKLGERLRKNRALAEALVARFGEGTENRQLRLNIELMHSILTDLFYAAEEDEAAEGVSFDPKDAHFLAKALDHLSKAQVKDAEFVNKLRDQASKEAKAEAGRAVDKVAHERGLSAAAVDALKRAIIGEPAPRLEGAPA